MGGGKKSSLTLYFAKEPLSSAWPVLFWLSLSYAFWRGHGLLVLADWTSQCCELEWHSVMDDLPHAALAKSLALCCRVFLTVKIHTALAKTGSFPLSLLLKPNAAETFFFFLQLCLRQWEYSHGLYPLRSPPPSVHTMKPCVRGTCQDRICTPRWTVILHECVTFSLIWNALCVLCKHMKACNVNRVVSWNL